MTAPVIGVRDVHRSYGRRRVLDGVDFDVRAGTLVGIVGENGAGKSTLLRCLVGLLEPDRGHVAVRGTIGYCPQEPILVDLLTCDEQFELFGAGYGLPRGEAAGRAARLMAFFGCERYAHTRVDQLSGGTRQKVNLIASLLHDPEVLILDEPYQGFDYETYLRFWDYAEERREEGRSQVIVSHLLAEQNRFDEILSLRDGRIAPTTQTHAGGAR
jgi:ABC-type multidrug transport system ATPase subunit